MAELSLIVGILTLLVTILAVITGLVVYINWKASKEYEREAKGILEDIQQQGQEAISKLQEEFGKSIRTFPSFASMSVYLSQALLYSQQVRRVEDSADMKTIAGVAPAARDALGRVLELLQQLKTDKLKLDKNGIEAFRKEVQNVKYNLENVRPPFQKDVQDLIERCSRIIELIDSLSFGRN